MKILSIFLILSPLISFAQTQVNKNNIEIGNKSLYQMVAEQKMSEGLTYIGSGEYLITEVGGTGFVGLSKLKKRAIEKIEKFVVNSNNTYKILNTQEFKTTVGVTPRVKINFLVYNTDGSLKITKDEAKKELMELNDLLKNGLITQAEFDKKAVGLKKVLLSN